MKLLIIRHGDPDYEHDTLTSRGWQEAELLAKRLEKVRLDAIYVSPLGRARDTASCTLKAQNRDDAVVCGWLREFPAVLDVNGQPALAAAYPDTKKTAGGAAAGRIAWDSLPSYWTRHPEYYHPEDWRHTDVAAHSDMAACYDYIIRHFDALLSKHGYERSGNCYRVLRPNTDTLAFFCHFGLECVLLSRLMNVSPFVLWHSMVMAPTSVTLLHTEEREKGVASFRAAQIGDISHLYAAGQEPSFSARFCEVYDDWSQRH